MGISTMACRIAVLVLLAAAAVNCISDELSPIPLSSDTGMASTSSYHKDSTPVKSSSSEPSPSSGNMAHAFDGLMSKVSTKVTKAEEAAKQEEQKAKEAEQAIKDAKAEASNKDKQSFEAAQNEKQDQEKVDKLKEQERKDQELVKQEEQTASKEKQTADASKAKEKAQNDSQKAKSDSQKVKDDESQVKQASEVDERGSPFGRVRVLCCGQARKSQVPFLVGLQCACWVEVDVVIALYCF